MREWAERSASEPGFHAGALGLSASAFTLLRDLIAKRTGLFYDDSKRDLLADKLSELVAAHGLGSFLDYYYLLRYDADAERHWAELLDQLSVPETYFYRQPEQIAAVAELLAPRHYAERPDEPLRIWSAACCTGEEPLSLAMALAEAGWLDRLNVEIVGSDASPAMVARAREGLYGERSFRAIPPELRRKYFRADGPRWRIDPALHARVGWTTANLLDPAEAGPLAEADVVFCRNVFIYFSDEAIGRVARMLAERMPATGHLFLGASESLLRLSSEFSLLEIGGAFVYAKQSGPAVPGPSAPRPSQPAAPARI